MRLLLVDDEALTREGLVASIDWNALKISEVLEADDGMNGWEAAKKAPPDIVLTDVRMPRLSGIEMCERIQRQNPDCPIIFMSGYSDKEYLKAAIKLKAVRYVEKPIDLAEVAEALKDAVFSLTQKKIQKQSMEMMHKETSSRLALKLTRPDYRLTGEESALLEELGFTGRSSVFFTTIILKFDQLLSEFADTELSQLVKKMDTCSLKRGLYQLNTLKHEEFLVLHLIGTQRPSEDLLKRLCRDFCSLLDREAHFFIVVGKTVTGADKVYQSYNSAVILLQSAFFCEYGSILIHKRPTPEHGRETKALSLPSIPEQFQGYLSEGKIQEARALADKLYGILFENRSILPNQSKDLYYKLLSAIISCCYSKKLSFDTGKTDAESLLDLVSGCKTVSELHHLLLLYLTRFDTLLHQAQPENTTIFLIRDYISKNYMMDTLSIKDISEHVNLSTSYLCTIFKTQTGQTLNQYITEFRIEKAKQLLRDSRNRISEISAKVGYGDGNYFSKSFKKSVGLSPSEFREKEML